MHSLFEGLGELCDGFRLVSGWLVHRLEVEFHICKDSKYGEVNSSLKIYFIKKKFIKVLYGDLLPRKSKIFFTIAEKQSPTMENNEIIYQHVYQNTVEGVLLFYDNTDRMIFFTILSVLSERYGIRIIAVSLMPDHYHLLVEASGRYPIVNFIRTLNSVYAKAFNRTINRKGRIFNKEFGCAPKRTPCELPLFRTACD